MIARLALAVLAAAVIVAASIMVVATFALNEVADRARRARRNPAPAGPAGQHTGDDKMSSTVIGDIVRSVIMGLGGILVTKGYIDSGALTALAGGGVVLVSLVWSFVTHKQA